MPDSNSGLVLAAWNALQLLEDLYPELTPNESTQDMAIWVTCEQLREALKTAGLTADALRLWQRMQTPNAMQFGGTFIRYESADEKAFNQLLQLGIVETFSLTMFGFKGRVKFG